ncbi:MAG: sigma-70 family RNA polymerase sigma factor [Planctomycetota bacterium]|jgi:RNA polymerase sigma-70 factor (ECF subfamily)
MAEPSLSDPSEWVDRHGDALYGYALLQLRDAEAAEERVQETLLAALEARRSFRGGSSERTWFMGILKHKICDQFRRRRDPSVRDAALAAEPVAAIFTASGIWKGKLQAWGGDPQADADRAEFWEAMRGCLSGLPSRMHDAFCLRELHGLATAEICQVLEISATNLWTLLHRSRALLRECLERRWFGKRGP